MRAKYGAEAAQEIRAASFFYDGRGEGLGLEFFEAVTSSVDQIEANPQLYPKVEESVGRRDIRRISLGRFPFAVIYEVRGEEIVIVAVAHHRQKPGYWTARRP